MDITNPTLKPYPAYKDSGVPWLGEIPAHWEMQPGFSAIREKQHKNTGMAETTVLSLSYGRIVIKPPEKLHGLVPASFETYQIVDPGDIIIRPTDLQNDWMSLRVGIARDRGIITSAYLCLRTVGPTIPEYTYWLLHAYDLMKVFYGMGSGLRQNLDFTDLKRMPVLVPPLPEQSAIAAFLTHIDTRVNRLIRVKRRMIVLLNEQKQAIIHRAVTRGLDPDVRLKPSGVEWLGEVPEHWEVRRLKSLITEAVAGPYGSSLTKAMYTKQGYRVYGQQQVIPDNFSVGDYYISAEKFAEMIRYHVTPNDVLVSVMGTVGRIAVVPESAEPGIINPRLVRYRPDFNKIRARYVQLAMQASPSQTQLAEGAKGTTMEGLNMQILGRLLILVPPLQEQDAILKNVDLGTQQLVSVINKAQREIDLIREYRTRLVADVVTGKLDVRGVDLAAYGDELAGLDEALADEDDEGEEEIDEVEEDAG